MMEQTKLKYFIAGIGIIVLLVLFLVFIYIFSVTILQGNLQTNFAPKPYKVLTTSTYKSGTTVSLYKEIPPIFPKEVVLENKTLDYSGVVTNAQEKVQITVSYISDKSAKDAVDFYINSLPRVGWNIEQSTVYAKVSIVKITKAKESVLISIVPFQKGGTMITFQYEK